MKKEYNERLKELREDADLTQQGIATILGTTKQQYYLYEKGKRKLTMEYLIKLTEFYNTSADYILGLTNDPRPYKRAQ